MNKLTMVVAIALSGALLMGAAPVKKEGTGKGLGQGGMADKFEVLDISIAKGWAAVRIVSHAESFGEEAGSVDCKYAGMQSLPKCGSSMATWDLAGGKAGDQWVIHKAVSKVADCTPQAVVDSTLAIAKTKIAAAGLDLAKKPALIAPAGGAFDLTIGGKPVKVAVKTDSAQDAADDSGMTWAVTAQLLVDGAQVYEVRQKFSRAGAGHATLEFPGAWVEGNKVVFVQKYTEGNMASADSSDFTFSPVIELGGAPASAAAGTPAAPATPAKPAGKKKFQKGK